MAIIRWEPMRFGPWRRWPRFFDEDWDWPEEISRGLNVYETKDSVVVEAAVPGVSVDKVEVEVEGWVLRFLKFSAKSISLCSSILSSQKV